MLKKIGRFVLGFILILLITCGVIYYKSVNYKMHSIALDKAHFADFNSKKGINILVDSLVNEMTLEEKVAQMYGEKLWKSAPKFVINALSKERFAHVYVGKNERLHIPPWVLSDGPRGARVMDHGINGVTTFPVGMARGASWDVSLERRVNEAIAKEMRANKTNYAATPCINLLRHPGWGRAQETYGEDPWHLGQFGVAAVNGIQAHNVMACPKHFALNSIDNSRWVVNVDVDERTLREVYLPHFKKVIQEGNAASIMSAYNFVRGQQCAANKELLTNILRDDWGFEGFVSTDWVFGLYDGIGGIKAGLDVEMPWQQYYTIDTIEDGLASGEITMTQIDAIITRSLKTRLSYAFAEDTMEYSKDLIANDEHVQLARETAEKSMVLLKNEGVLPFRSTSNKKVAVIGRLADTANTGDQGSSNSTPPYVVTPYQGIAAYHEALQGNEVIYDDGTDIEAAKRLAESVDQVILVVGFTHLEEGEYIIFSRDEMIASAKAQKLIGKKGAGGDRTSLKLLAEDEQLIKAVAPLNKKTVVTYIGGSAIDMSSWEADAPAILFTWYAGMEGGHALANILYGDINPSGKLPFSIAQNEADYPEFNPYTEQITYGYYHGYTLFEKEEKPVAYPFGFGLSYTTYEYSDLTITNPILTKDDTIEVQVNITNTGTVKGEEIAQFYVGFKNSEIDRPIKLLRGFDKVALVPGETKMVTFSLPVAEIAYYNPANEKWEIEHMSYELYVGGSSKQEDLLMSSFEVVESTLEL